jgi:hypothetical protein
MGRAGRHITAGEKVGPKGKSKCARRNTVTPYSPGGRRGNPPLADVKGGEPVKEPNTEKGATRNAVLVKDSPKSEGFSVTEKIEESGEEENSCRGRTRRPRRSKDKWYGQSHTILAIVAN